MITALKQRLKKFFRHHGIHVQQVMRESDSYGLVTPIASYSPWKCDKPFQKVYQRIKEHTLVDLYRCYELWKLVEQSAKLEKGSLIEIGVWRGGSAALISAMAKHCAIQDPLYLCDTFTGVVKANEKDANYVGGEHADTSQDIVESLFRSLDLNNATILQGVFPDQTGSRIVSGEMFRFCHIDVDVYQSAKDITEWVWPKLVPGGLVVFDDYGAQSTGGVTRYVNELVTQKDCLFIHNLNGHGILVKTR